MKKNSFELLLLVAYCAIFVMKFGPTISYLLFVIGIVVGSSFWLFELLFRVYYLVEDQTVSQTARQYLRQRRFGTLFHFFQQINNQVQLTSESTLFLLIYIPLAIFVLTSTGSVLGVGIILGMGFHYATDIFQLRLRPELLRQTYLRQLKLDLEDDRLEILGWVALLAFVVLSVFVLV